MAFVKEDVSKDAAKDEKPKATGVKDAKQAKADSKPKRTGPKKKPGPANLEAKLTESVKGLGMALATAGQIDDGMILISRGPALCSAWADVAESNAQVKRVLTALVTTGVWSGVILSSASVALPIIQNHGIANGVPNPFVLTSDDVEEAFAEMPESLQTIIRTRAMAQAAAQAAQPMPPQGAPGPVAGPNGSGMPQGEPATVPNAHEPE